VSHLNRTDVGDVEVQWRWSGDDVVIVALAPHFEGAALHLSDAEIVEAIEENEAQKRDDLRSAADDQRYHEAKDDGRVP
jgi:hypothetical protein